MTDQLVLPKLTDKRRAALAHLGVTTADELLHYAAEAVAAGVNEENERTRTTPDVAERWLLRAAQMIVGGGPERLDPATLAGWELYATFGVYFQRRETADDPAPEHRVVVNHLESDAEALFDLSDLRGLAAWLRARARGDHDGAEHILSTGAAARRSTGDDLPPSPASHEAEASLAADVSPAADDGTDTAPDADGGPPTPGSGARRRARDDVEIVAVRALAGPRRLDLTGGHGPCPQLRPGWALEVEVVGSADHASAELILDRVDGGSTTIVVAAGAPPVLRSTPVHADSGYHHALLSLRAADSSLLGTVPLEDILVTA